MKLSVFVVGVLLLTVNPVAAQDPVKGFWAELLEAVDATKNEAAIRQQHQYERALLKTQQDIARELRDMNFQELMRQAAPTPHPYQRPPAYTPYTPLMPLTPMPSPLELPRLRPLQPRVPLGPCIVGLDCY